MNLFFNFNFVTYRAKKKPIIWGPYHRKPMAIDTNWARDGKYANV